MKTKRLLIIFLASILILVVVVLAFLLRRPNRSQGNPDTPSTKETVSTTKETETEPPTADPFLSGTSIAMNLIPVNEYSRPGTELKEVRGVVVHYVGNPGSTAVQNRDYFAGLAQTHERSASSHYVIGLQGEIIQCIPLNEIAYASNQRNGDTIAIECCHPNEDGQFTHETYEALVRLCAALCNTYGLNPETDVIRHYDVTGKDCPKYYVDHEDYWDVFKLDVRNRMR